MNPIEKQKKLINKIYELVYKSAEDGFETAECLFKYDVFDDGSASINSIFSYNINGENISSVLPYPNRMKLSTVIPELHSAMKEHTGGDWRAFTLRINKDSSVTTNFDYA